jgi:anaerobic selenocysteine-containing dehydrogenase
VVRRADGTFEEVTWDDAFARCTELLLPVIGDHGIGAVTAFVGNPLAHGLSLSRYIGVLIGMSGIPMIYSPGTVDQWPKNVSSHLMYGGMWTIPVPDVRRSDLFVVMGANPSASQGSLLACPDVMGEIDAIRARGGEVVVVDPRRTGTADRAGEWLPITPGTDAALLLAVVNDLFADGLVDLGGIGDLVEGVEQVQRVAAEWTPERVAPVTGISAERIRRLAHQLAETERAVVYGRIGLCNQEFGTLASWLVDVVNILTRHFDVPGGLMFPRAAAWPLTLLPMPGLEGGASSFGRWRSRVRGAPEVLGHVPASCLAEEIATPGEGQIRALFTVAGNPVLSTPGGDRLDDALDGLDCMISVDNWINETTRHADVILPGLSALEQAHHDDLIWQFAVGSGAKYSAPVFPPADGRPHEWEILIRLAGLCLGQPAGEVDVAAIDDGFFDALAAVRGLDGPSLREGYDEGGPERVIDFTLRTGPFGDRYGEVPDGLTLEKVKAEPHGIDLGPQGPPPPRGAHHPGRQGGAGPALHHGRPAPAGRAPRPPAGGAGPRQPPPPALEQLVDAQRAGPREGQGPLHPPAPPRRRRPLRHRRRPPRQGQFRGRLAGGHRRGHRRHQARRGLAPARLGPRQARHAPLGGQRARRRQHQRAVAGRVRRCAVGQRRRQRHPGDRQPGLGSRADRRGDPTSRARCQGSGAAPTTDSSGPGRPVRST